MTEGSATKMTTAQKKERLKEVQGDVNMVVKMPDGCTSATNCEYICTKMVDHKGGKDEAADLTTLEDAANSARRLAADTIKTEYTATGYEADSTANSGDFESDFVEVVETTGANSWVIGFSMIMSLLFIFFK